jgi:hypothetical protein
MKGNEALMDSLNEQQVMMLRLFKVPLSNDDFTQIRRLAVKLLSKKMDETLDRWEQDNNVDKDTYDQLGQGHFRTSNKK